jgi:cytoskeletal protein CcmA (bactofilin family)
MSWRSRKESEPAVDNIENLVGRSCTVRGDLSAEGVFRIDGTVEGSVETKTSVVVGESGTVTGNIRATDVVVAGRIHGNVCCTGHLEIVGTGIIEGDIAAKSLRIEIGGVFSGTSNMGPRPNGGPKGQLEAPDGCPQLSAVR